MRMWKPTVQSLFGMLGKSDPSTTQIEDVMEEIQETMLAALGKQGQSLHPTVARRIEFASDVTGLWHLRPDLMRALTSVHGQAKSISLMRKINAKFDGVRPSDA